MKIIKIHNKISKEIKENDIDLVIKDSEKMFELCEEGNGIYLGGFALAHSQVSDEPLRFFITVDRLCIINPKIIRHTNFLVDSEEGCLSFPEYPQVIIGRYNKCEVHCDKIIDFNDMSFQEDITLKLNGKQSFIYQHEIDHLDGINIYEKDYTVKN
jgi:peptide deformylase